MGDLDEEKHGGHQGGATAELGAKGARGRAFSLHTLLFGRGSPRARLEPTAARPAPQRVAGVGGGRLKMREQWTCGKCGTALRPPKGKLVAAMAEHAKVCPGVKRG
jgi:hypothetical protein